jgi:hypothetical protein
VAGRNHFNNTLSLVAAVSWVASLAIWLYNAHMLEFLGVNNFLGVWISSLLFHLVNVGCIAFFIVDTD